MTDTRLARWWRQAGLVVHLTAWYVATLAVALLALSLFLYVALARSLESSTFVFLGGEARSVQRELQSGVSGGQSFAAAATAATTNVAAPGVGVVVLDASGLVVARSRGPLEQAPDPPADGLATLRGGADQWTALLDAAPRGRTALLVQPIFSDGANASDPGPGRQPGPKPKGGEHTLLGYLQLSTPTAQSDAALQSTVLFLGIGVALVLLLVTLASPRVTRLGLRPLRGLAAASRQLAQGNLSARASAVQSHDEVGELARAFNDMASRLEASFAAQRAFVADSDELRTPLTALGGQLDVLPRAIRVEPAEAERLAGSMRRQVTRLSGLVADLLALARLDAQGSASLQVAPVDLADIARDVYEQARALPLARGKDLSLDVAGPVVVQGDATRLHQVLLNVVQNALQHAPGESGWVRLSVAATAQHATVVVQDNGPGIPVEHLGRVFDRFYRADAARVHGDGRAGLGLAIVQGIVAAHQGTVTAANDPRGGAIVSVTLPLSPPLGG